MIDPEFLYAVAQVGATYAGFSTLVAVVAYRRDTGPIPGRIYYMLLLSIIVVAFSFVPAVVQNYGAGVWGKSIGAVYATALFIMLYMSAYLFLQVITGLLEHNASS